MNDLNRRLQEDIEKFGVIAGIIVACLFIGFFFYLFFVDDNSIEETRLEEFSGIVLDKYVIRQEHGSEVMKIMTKDKEEKVIYLNRFDTDVFDKLQIGDTIYTKSGESKVHINRKDTSFSIDKTE